jgi:transcriptional antiterminator
LLFELLTQDSHLTGRQLASRLGVSLATLARDLVSAEVWLEDHGLYLQRRPRLGTMVVGREEDWRHALVSLILDSGLESELLQVCLWAKRPFATDGYALVHPARYRMLREIDRWHLGDAWRYIRRIENGLGITIAESDHLSLSLYWAIMVNRYQKGHTIRLSENELKAQQFLPEYVAIEAVATLFEQETGVRLPAQEKAQLTIEVLTAAREPSSTPSQGSQSPLPAETLELARRIVDGISQRLGSDMDHPEVLYRLAEHLSRSLLRLRHGLPIRNPLTDDVQRGYPGIWSATQETLEALGKDLGQTLPREEVAFIVMYMGVAMELNRRLMRRRGPRVIVACPTGGVTAWMLLSRLRSEFPELDVAHVVSVLELHKVDLQDVDAIISTVQLHFRQVPVITISPLVTESEVNRVRQELGLMAHAGN